MSVIGLVRWRVWADPTIRRRKAQWTEEGQNWETQWVRRTSEIFNANWRTKPMISASFKRASLLLLLYSPFSITLYFHLSNSWNEQKLRRITKWERNTRSSLARTSSSLRYPFFSWWKKNIIFLIYFNYLSSIFWLFLFLLCSLIVCVF